MMRVIIVDNELDSITDLELRIVRLAEQFKDEITIIGKAYNYDEAHQMLVLSPQLIFLDSDLGEPNKHGYDFFKDYILDTTIDVLFLTGEEKDPANFFSKGLKFTADIDVLYKPLTDQRLIEAINKVIEKRRDSQHGINIKNTYKYLKDHSDNPYTGKSIFTNGRQVRFDKIVYIEADGYTSKIFLCDEKFITVTKNLKQLELILCDDLRFVRLQRDYILNIDFLKGFRTDAAILKSDLFKKAISADEQSFPKEHITINPGAVKLLKMRFVRKK